MIIIDLTRPDMSSVLFSRIYVNEPTELVASERAAGPRGSRSGRKKSAAPRSEVFDHERLVQALASSFKEALGRVLPAEFLSGDKTFAPRLAEQTADFLAGRSVTLQLNREL